MLIRPTTIIVPQVAPSLRHAAGTTDFVRRSESGLFVPSGAGLARSGAALVVPQADRPLDMSAEGMLRYAQSEQSSVAARDGAAAAEIRMGKQIGILERVAADERHARVMELFRQGRVEV